MPTTRTFVVDKVTSRLSPIQGNPREYWVPGMKFEGTVKLLIEVFASDSHELHAEELRRALARAGLENKYFHIKIEVKS